MEEHLMDAEHHNVIGTLKAINTRWHHDVLQAGLRSV